MADQSNQKKPKKETPPSITKSREAISSIAKDNTVTDKEKRVIQNIERRLTHLEKQPTIKAANFGSANFGATDLGEALGVDIPCATYQSCANVVEQVVTGRMLHPKRFGSRDESLVMKTSANNIVTVPPDFSGTLYVSVPTLSSYKGAVVFARDGTELPYVLAYIAPDKDPERVGTMCAALFNKLVLSAPSVIAGTTLATAQLMLELYKTTSFPASLIPGKAAAMAVGSNCPIQVIGPEPHTICNFTATDPANIVKRFSTFDQLNPQRVYLPTQYTSANPGAYPIPSQAFVIQAVATSTSEALASGFSEVVATNWNNIAVPIPSATTVWRLRDNSDSQRHMLFGDFIFEGTFTIANSSMITLRVEYALEGGLTESVLLNYGATGNTTNIRYNTRGDSVNKNFKGYIVRDIEVIIAPFEGPAPNGYFGPQTCVSITWLDVPATMTYLGATISGAREGYRIAVAVETHTEVVLDPSALNTSFLTPTSDLPYDELMYPNFIRSIYHANTEGFTAASFTNVARKVMRIGGKAGKLLAPMAGRHSGLVEQISDNAIKFGSLRAAGYGSEKESNQMNSIGTARADVDAYADVHERDGEVSRSEGTGSFCTAGGGFPSVDFDSKGLTSAFASVEERRRRMRMSKKNKGERAQRKQNTKYTKPVPPPLLRIEDDETLKISPREDIREESLKRGAEFLRSLKAQGKQLENPTSRPDRDASLRSLFAPGLLFPGPMSFGLPFAVEEVDEPELKVTNENTLLLQTAFAATGFSAPRRTDADSSTASRGFDVFFPAVDTKHGDFIIVPVLSDGVPPECISSKFRDGCAGVPRDLPIEGTSSSLACLIGTLRMHDFPALPGCFSGEVSNVHIVWSDAKISAVSFELSPVDEEFAKFTAALRSNTKLTGYFKSGWFKDNLLTNFAPQHLFKKKIHTSYQGIGFRAGYPQESLLIEAWI